MWDPYSTRRGNRSTKNAKRGEVQKYFKKKTNNFNMTKNQFIFTEILIESSYRKFIYIISIETHNYPVYAIRLQKKGTYRQN